jgi:hypothetical protein
MISIKFSYFTSSVTHSSNAKYLSHIIAKETLLNPSITEINLLYSRKETSMKRYSMEELHKLQPSSINRSNVGTIAWAPPSQK